MKKVLLAAVVMMLFLAVVSSAEIFKINNLAPGTIKLAAREKSSGRPLWQSVFAVSRTKYQGQEALYLKETASGIYGKEKQNLNWVTESYYLLTGRRLIPAYAKSVFNDQNGQTVKTVEKKYDLPSSNIVCLINGQKQNFFFRPDLIGIELIGPVLSNYPFDEKRDFVFYLLTNEPTVYRMTLKFRGAETINIGGHNFLANKLEMIIDLGALGILGAFVPKTYFWFDAAAPHKFLKYEGLESGLGTAYIVEEIVP